MVGLWFHMQPLSGRVTAVAEEDEWTEKSQISTHQSPAVAWQPWLFSLPEYFGDNAKLSHCIVRHNFSLLKPKAYFMYYEFNI